MYRKNLVTTLALATMIAVATTGCNKETTISALDTAQEVVASVEEKTVEKAVEDNIIASVDKTAKETKTPASTSTASVAKEAPSKEESTKTVVVPKEEYETTDAAEYFTNTPVEQWDHEYFFEKFASIESDEYIDEDDVFFTLKPTFNEEELERYNECIKEKVAQYEQIRADRAKRAAESEKASQEYDGPHPTGPKASDYPTYNFSGYTSSGLRGNIS